MLCLLQARKIEPQIMCGHVHLPPQRQRRPDFGTGMDDDNQRQMLNTTRAKAVKSAAAWQLLAV
jgi:hypothetical protein